MSDSPVTRVEKPWGYELHWAKTDRYVGKLIHVNAGHALSLQYHNQKDETIFLWSGRMLFEIKEGEELVKREMKPGEAVHVTPGTVHRMTAIDDCDILEVSTPELDDVVRLEDRYGRVEKPWGYELHWAKTDRYVGKVLHVKAGHALSLQYHNRKDETIYLYSGRMLFEIERDGQLTRQEMRPGDSVHVTPKTVHRMTAIEDCDILEVSTPELDDVVRLEDRYGRVEKP